MVSPLWKASSEGNLAILIEFLKEATSVDIEVKDHTGVTPLIEAVKNGHVEVVRILLDRGADPINTSSQGPPESYTSDPVVLELLSAAKSRARKSSSLLPDGAYHQEQQADINHFDPTTNGYYPPPPPPDAYYYPVVPPQMYHDGTVPYFVPPPHIPADQNPTGLGNLPPPEVARMIPCRYYPACRYGPSCMFAHPQGQYVQGVPPPPSQYHMPYDSVNQSPYPPPTYYPVPPGAYGPSPNGVPVNHISPPPSLIHTSSGSEVLSPVQGPYTPSNGQPSAPYGVLSPISPTYGHPAPVPIPISVPPLPPLQTSPTASQSPPQQHMYTPISPNVPTGASPYAPQYVPQNPPPNGEAANFVSPKSPRPHTDRYTHVPISKEMSHQRRGSARRPSFGGRGGKPPCLFFPSGRCKNGDECRFPHVLPDGPGNNHPSHFSVRGGHRPRPPFHANGMAILEDSFAAMATQDVKASVHSRNGTGAGTDSRSQSAEPGNKGRAPLGPSRYANGFRQGGRSFGPVKPQRVPSADEFPVLSGSVPLSCASSNGTMAPGYSGPTAAQVLQAPAPRRDVNTRGNTPDQLAPAAVSKLELNGGTPEPVNKFPLSFAAAATAVPEAAKEVSVSA